MTMRKVTGVQFPMLFDVTFGPADVGNTIEIDVPPNFVLTDAALIVRTAFDGTTPTVGVIDNKTAPTSIIPAGTALSLGETLSGAGPNFTEYPSGGIITISPVIAGGANTVGSADVMIRGYVKGRQNERYGT